MKYLQVAMLIIIIALAVSLEYTYTSMSYENQQLNSKIAALNQSYEQLSQNYQSLGGLTDILLASTNSSALVPVSEASAIEIALNYGGWNSSALNGMTVSATLTWLYIANGSNGASAYGIANSPSNMTVDLDGWIDQPAYNETITWYHIWEVVVESNGLFRSIPPPGLYWVDASTGEIIATPPLM